MLHQIFTHVDENIALSKDEAVALLSVSNLSPDYYALLAKASALSQQEYHAQGYLFVQIGLDSQPCSGNCKFCSLAKCNHAVAEIRIKTTEEVLLELRGIDFSKISALFLMSTAEYDREQFLACGRAARAAIPAEVDLVANVGDFDPSYAAALKKAGFTGAYHIVRLREGSDTGLPKAQRIATLDAIRAAGLRLYYCVEPIGPEHSYEELAEEMLRAREYRVDIMACMRRVAVAGTAFENSGEISDFELAKIVAVTRLVTRPAISMNVHEPVATAMLAGVNQLYAELGANPRDTHAETEHHRGFSIARVEQLLQAAGYRV